jgi:hypothetical protein
VRRVLGDGLGQVADDGGVGVEEVIARHAGLARDAGGDDDDLGARQAVAQGRGGLVVAGDLALGIDVADIGSDACRVRFVNRS